ncbi:MAG: TraR/DksA family transcriptional regulator [Nitrospinae bacterium]|nr:TraR/DksA family transcriptional regulator [Nitrospinota bacterium]
MDTNKVPKFQAKLEEIRASLVGDVARNLKTNKEEFSDIVADINDDATRTYNRQLMLNLGEQDWEKLKQVEEALGAIKKGVYGICQKCEKSIPEARLNIVPFAKYCVECLSEIEKEKLIPSQLQ